MKSCITRILAIVLFTLIVSNVLYSIHTILPESYLTKWGAFRIIVQIAGFFLIGYFAGLEQNRGRKLTVHMKHELTGDSLEKVKDAVRGMDAIFNENGSKSI